MSLNNITLPPQLVIDLYRHSLIEGSARAMPQKKAVDYLGKNGKNILILAHHTSAPFLPDKELNFLTTVLAACQLDLSHVAIVNWNNVEEKNEGLLAQFNPKEILFLDILPSVLGFGDNAKPYAVQKKDDIQFVYTPALSRIEKTKEAKKELWMALKQIFCLS